MGCLSIRDALPEELDALGRLLIEVYSTLEGFPTPAEQPNYYAMLADVGRFAAKPGTRVLVAVTPQEKLAGGVVYVGNMTEYGSGGAAGSVKNAAGIRLLGVSRQNRARGAGRALTNACIQLAIQARRSQVILHTTQAMTVAWRLYETLGFVRSEDLDFWQQELPVFGFRLSLP